MIAATVILLSACGGGTDASIATIHGPALLFFYTDNWAPWAQTAPIVDGLEQTYGARVSVIRIDFNSDQGQALARRYQVRNHPTIVVIDRSGTPRATIFGVPDRFEVEQAIAKVVTWPS